MRWKKVSILGWLYSSGRVGGSCFSLAAAVLDDFVGSFSRVLLQKYTVIYGNTSISTQPVGLHFCFGFSSISPVYQMFRSKTLQSN